MSSPIQTPMIRALAPDEAGVQLRRPLNDADTVVLNALLADKPSAWVRIYSGPGQAAQDWSWLGRVPRIRRVWLDLLPEHRFDVEWLDALPADIDSLYLPGAADAGAFTERLERFSRITSLSVSGRLRSLASISKLRGLKELKIFCGNGVSFEGLSGSSCIQKLSIERSRKVALTGLEGVATLADLDVFDSGLVDTKNIARIASLERLSLVCAKLDGELPSLECLSSLKQLRISTLKPGYRLDQVLSARSLEVLSLDAFKKDCVDRDSLGIVPLPNLAMVYLGKLNESERARIEGGLGVHIDRENRHFPFFSP
jgi:hypothetical protein